MRLQARSELVIGVCPMLHRMCGFIQLTVYDLSNQNQWYCLKRTFTLLINSHIAPKIRTFFTNTDIEYETLIILSTRNRSILCYEA